MRSAVSHLLIVAFAVGLGACAGELENPEAFTTEGNVPAAAGQPGPASKSACGDVSVQVLAAKCATSGCHSAEDPAVGLDLASPDVRTRLSGKAASEAGHLLVDPAAPEKSALYTKLFADPPFGTRMPLGRSALDAASTACVLEWLRGG